MSITSAFFSKLRQKGRAIKKLGVKGLLSNPLYLMGLLLACMLPFVFTLSALFLKKKEFNRLETQFEQIKIKIKRSAIDQKEKEGFLKKINDADRDFLDKEVQKISLKPLETSFFKNLGEQVKWSRGVEETNQLYFESLGMFSKKQIKEETLALNGPIEVEGEDINAILSLIEEEKDSSPQLIVHTFDLKKGENLHGKECYFLDLKLIKREGI